MNLSTQRTVSEYLVSTIVTQHTDAPLRIKAEFVFDASQTLLFRKVTEPQEIASWFGMIRNGNSAHETSCHIGEWGEGSKRICKTYGMGTLDETILYWDAPQAYAYTVKNFMMPIQDHVALITVEKISESQSKLTWLHFFHDKGFVMKNFFPSIMAGMMKQGLKVLGKQFGGHPGKVEVI